MTESLVASLVANSAGHLKGTSAPCFLDTSTISSESIDTIIQSIYFELTAASIVKVIRGIPQSNFIFIHGIPFDAPRAVIIAKILLSENIETIIIQMF